MTMLVLLDRDGVINQERGEYVTSPEEMALIDGAAAAIRRLNKAGFRIAVITNQGCIGRGLIDEARLEEIHDRMHALLAAEGARIDRIYVCPDAPWAATERRKPAPGMLREALRDFAARPEDTPFIGDSLRDLQAACAIGCQPVLVRTGHGRRTEREDLSSLTISVKIHDDLDAAVDYILSPDKAGGCG